MEPKCEEQIEEPAAAWTLGVPFENQNPFHRELLREADHLGTTPLSEVCGTKHTRAHPA